MKRKAHHFTVAGLSEHLHRSRSSTLKLIKAAGIELTPIELNYVDEARPRTRRNWRHLTAQEADQVISYVRRRQGEAVERRASAQQRANARTRPPAPAR